MRARQTLPRALSALAHRQAGVLSSQQLRDGGVTAPVAHRLSRSWLQPTRGIYVCGPLSWHSAVWVGILRGGEGAAAGGRAAAYLHGLLREPPSEIVIAAGGRRSSITLGPWQVGFHRVRRVGVGTPPRSKVEPTLIDMARVCSENEMVAALAAALAQGRTVASRVLEELDSRRRVAHSSLIRSLCEHAMAGMESALEWRFHQGVVLPHGLPIPLRQVRTGEGRVDGLYPEFGVIVELDGLRDHQDPSKDMMRDNQHLIMHDLRTLRYGWSSVVMDACRVAEQIARLLTKLGWQGALRPCRYCRPRAAA